MPDLKSESVDRVCVASHQLKWEKFSHKGSKTKQIGAKRKFSKHAGDEIKSNLIRPKLVLFSKVASNNPNINKWTNIKKITGMFDVWKEN